MNQYFNQEETNKFTITSTCIIHSLLDDYCNHLSWITEVDKEIIRKRILDKADDNLQKLKEITDIPIVMASAI